MLPKHLQKTRIPVVMGILYDFFIRMNHLGIRKSIAAKFRIFKINYYQEFCKKKEAKE